MENRIKELRKKKGITQEKLCKEINIARPTLAGYELNSHEPDFATTKKIADYFNVTIGYLMGYEEIDYFFEYQHANTKLTHIEKK
jgi:transcriptional regulator with XRE-family HTH domain